MKKLSYKEIIELYNLQDFVNEDIILIKSEKKEIEHVVFYAQNRHDIHGNEEALINLDDCVRILKKQDAMLFF